MEEDLELLDAIGQKKNAENKEYQQELKDKKKK